MKKIVRKLFGKMTIRKLLKLELVILLIAGIGAGSFLIARSTPRTLVDDLPQIARALYVTELSYLRQGEGKPVDPDYTGGDVVTLPGEDPNTDQLTWGLYSNSVWLTQLFRDVVPYYAYENLVAEGRTPVLVAFFPMDNSDSFHILGQFTPYSDAVILNERMIYDVRYNDDRSILGTLIHEGLHAQGGNYLDGGSVWLESHTVAGTLEVEAAMCNYGNEVACRTFWYDLHDLAKSTVRSYARKYNVEPLFAFFNKLFWRDSKEWTWADKAIRFWASNQGELSDILYRYDQLPFEEMVMPALCQNRWFDTGLHTTNENGDAERLFARFDDAQYMLGYYRLVACLNYKYTPAPSTMNPDPLPTEK